MVSDVLYFLHNSVQTQDGEMIMTNAVNEENTELKSEENEYKLRITAGLLQLFCGAFGIGRFYIGYKTYAILQILFSLLTCGVGGVLWGFVDGVMILTGVVHYDGKGKQLV